jgi:hypothetical protein
MISALDNHLLRAYLGGEMDEAAAEAFEILMIERPELAELVDADTALRLGLASDAAAAHAVPAAGTATVVTLPRPARARTLQWVPLLAAASVMLAVGLGLGRLWSPQPADLVQTTLLSVDRMRSSVSVVPKLRLPANGQIVLSVPVAADPGCTRTVRILQSGVVLQAQATPDDFGFANREAARAGQGRSERRVRRPGARALSGRIRPLTVAPRDLRAARAPIQVRVRTGTHPSCRYSGDSAARKSAASKASPGATTPNRLHRPVTKRSIASTTSGAVNA